MNLKNAEKIIKQNKDQIVHLGARSLSLFGSVARKEETNQSDIDILIDFDPKKGMFVFLELKSYLETILKCPVDLVTKRALHPALRTKILQEAKSVF